MSAFDAVAKLKRLELFKGVTGRSVKGERITLAVVDLDPNSVVPEHHHENEQLGFVIKGTLIFRIGTETRNCVAGDTYVIPSNVPHQVTTGPEGATVCDAFAPTRADWEKLEKLPASPPRWP